MLYLCVLYLCAFGGVGGGVQVGDIRDDLALVQGKSTYMFRIDDDYIVDAMFKGNASRFMNHCCEPNCYCQVVSQSHPLSYAHTYILF